MPNATDASPEDGEKMGDDRELFLGSMRLKDHFERLLAETSAAALSGGHNQGRWEIDPREAAFAGLNLAASLVSHPARARRVAAAVASGVRADEWWPVRVGLVGQRCWVCGESMALETNGLELRCANPCRFPEGLSRGQTLELAVPSGQMVFGNDFRPQFPCRDGELSMMSMLGTMTAVEANARAGMAHGFCGNTCPTIYALGRKKRVDRLAVGGSAKGARRVGYVCTDLWWYSVADLAMYESRHGEVGRFETVVDVRPGVYAVTHHGHYVNRDEGRPVYAEIQWLRDA